MHESHDILYQSCNMHVPHPFCLLFTDGYLHLLQWTPREALSAPVSSAIYSCDGLLVYAGFCDGAVGVFDADSLRLRCRIAPSAYIPASVSRYASEILPRHFVFQTTEEH